jgi:capsular exopolysaccharide synthesis family protein
MKSQSAQQASEWLEQRVASLRNDVFAADRAVAQFQSSGNPLDQFKLSELKSAADTYRKLYETYLTNWTEAKQKISYPVSDATFVSRAAVPVSKSQPKSTLLMVFALVLGASTGLVVAIIRHFARQVITSTDRITYETALPCIGAVALAASSPRQSGPALSLPRVQGLGQKDGIWNRGFNRDLRELKATITGMRRSKKANLIGVVGVNSKAGATTLAYNLAILASSSGSKTLLIDASAANPTLSRTFTAEQSIGLMEMLDDRQTYIDFMSRVEKRLTILPVGAFHDVTPGERIGSERIAFSFADLKDRFDLVLVDLPSMPGSADAKAVAPHLDGSIIVVRAGQTPFDALDHVVGALREVNAEILGVVLNATPSRKPGKR